MYTMKYHVHFCIYSYIFFKRTYLYKYIHIPPNMAKIAHRSRQKFRPILSTKKTPRTSTCSARSGTIRALTWRFSRGKKTVEVYYLYIRCIYKHIKLNLSIFLSTYLSIHQNIYLSIYQSFQLSIIFYAHWFTYLFISLVSLAIYLAFYLSNPLLSLCSMPIERPISLIQHLQQEVEMLRPTLA